MSRAGAIVRDAAALRLATALAALAGVPAGALEVTATVQPETLTVGDRAEVLLTVTGDRSELLDLAGGEPRFPAWGDRWADAEVVEVGPVEPVLDLARGTSGQNGRAGLFRQRLVVTAFRTGRVALPPREIALPGPGGTVELTTPADLALTIDSVLPAELADTAASEIELRPPAPPRALPLGLPFWATLAAGGAILLGLFALARRRSAVAEPAARLSPRDELVAALAAASEAEEPGAGHVRLSRGLRRFLGRSYGFRAVESTTSEVRRQLRNRHAPAGTEARVHEVLVACDRVKFAREAASRDALEARIAAAREAARELEEHLRPPEAGEGGADGGRRGRRERAA
jgi:hypothetical protein